MCPAALLSLFVLLAVALSGCGSGGSSSTTTSSSARATAPATPVASVSDTSTTATSASSSLAPGQLFAVMPCSGKARAILAHLAAVPDAKVTQVRYTAPSGADSCRMTVTGKHTGRVVVALELDTAPQAYFRLEREAVEDAQAFATSTTHTYPPPQDLAGVGLEADWFPGEQKAMTTDGKTLYSVLITWPHVKMAREKALGAHIALALVGHTPETAATTSSTA